MPLLALLVLSFLVYAPSLGNGFAMDDVPLAQAVDDAGKADEILDGWQAPWSYFGRRYWAGVDNTSELYRPFTVWSYAVTWNAVGVFLPRSWEAFPHHLLNLLLHCLAVWLVHRMARDLGCSASAALATAAMFGLHALHSEVVAGIVGRAELLAFDLGLAATLLFSRGALCSAGVLFFLAFCSKESALAWAPFLPCQVFARGGTLPKAQLRAMAAVLLPALAVFFALRAAAIADLPPGITCSYDQNPLAYEGTATRLLTAVTLLGYGLWQCVAPFELYSLYGPGAVPIVASPLHGGFLAAAVVLLAWLCAGLWFARRLPLLFLSVAAFLGFAFLTSNIPIVIGTVYGERLFYMPSLGVCLLPALLLPRLGATGRRVLLGLLAVWAAACCVVILERNGAWRDTRTLFLTDAERLPQSADLQAKAGYVLMDKDPERAMQHFRRSVELDPEIAGSWASIGRLHERRGELAQAAVNYKRALDTRYAATSGTESRTIDDYLHVLVAAGRVDEAVAFATGVLQRRPRHYFARILVLDHGAQLQKPEWRRLLDEGLRLHGSDRLLFLFQAMDAYESGADPRQVAHGLQAGLEGLAPGLLAPTRVLRARLYLADSLARSGQRDAAAALYREVLRTPGLPVDVRARIEASVQELAR